MTLLALAALLLVQESPFDRGKRFLEERNPKEAEREFREVVSRNPGDARGSYYLGIALARQEKAEEAILFFENARRLAGRPNASILYELGSAYSKLERWDDAERALREATDLVPRESSMRLQLGWVYYSKLEGEKARAEFERVIATAPSAMAYLYLGLTEIGLGRNDPAIAALEKAIDIDQRLLDAHVALGKVLSRAGRDEEAAAVLRRALDLDARSAESHFQLGLLALRRGDLESAAASFSASIDADPGHLQAWYNRALACERLGRADEAKAAWVRVAELRAAGAEEPDPHKRTRARTR